MSIKQIFKTFYNNLKSWGWYEWVKYVLAAFLCIVAVFMLGWLLYFGISESGQFDEIVWVILLWGLLLVLPIFATALLIIKDYRLPYLLLIGFSVLFIYWSLQRLGVYYDDYPRILDIIAYIFIIISIVNICKISFDKKILQKYDETLLSALSLFFICGGIIVLSMLYSLSRIVPDDDGFLFEIEKECIETKISKGYPRDFARDYCLHDGRGCVEKGYDKDCEVGLKCCFATIEEDKKWNYLDYDEKGNRIKE